MALNLRSGKKRNHAYDFDFPENLKIWSHCGLRSIAHLLHTPARLNRYPRISDAGGLPKVKEMAEDPPCGPGGKLN